jgi:hypothetical protein
MNLPFSFERAWMSQVSFCLNYNPDLKVGAKDRVPFKFLFHLFGSLLKSAPAFRLVVKRDKKARL